MVFGTDDNLLGTNSNIRLKNIQVFLDEGLKELKLGQYGANERSRHMI